MRWLVLALLPFAAQAQDDRPVAVDPAVVRGCFDATPGELQGLPGCFNDAASACIDARPFDYPTLVRCFAAEAAVWQQIGAEQQALMLAEFADLEIRPGFAAGFDRAQAAWAEWVELECDLRREHWAGEVQRPYAAACKSRRTAARAFDLRAMRTGWHPTGRPVAER